MRLGVGLGIFIIIGVILNLLEIPIDWRIFLVLSLIYPGFKLFQKIRAGELSTKLNFSQFKLTKSNLNILIVLLIFFLSFYMYASGSFAYPYFEDDDPWTHSLSVKYIATEKTLDEPQHFDFKYLDPYPPGYGLIMGTLHQTSSSLMWTLKFFNALIIALGLLFFYFFAKEFMNSKNMALFSTFILAAIPCYFTHFVWALVLAPPMFFVSMYYLEWIKYDSKSLYVAGLAIAGLLLTQPSMAFKAGVLLLVYFIIKNVIHKINLKQTLYACVLGILVSLLWWFKHGMGMVLRGARAGGGKNTLVAGESLNFIEYIQRTFPPSSGTATRAYSFKDFFVSQPFGGINVQIGFGIVISLLLILALIYVLVKHKQVIQKRYSWVLISVLWFVLMFLNINSLTFNLPVGFFSFRSWLLLAIPVALLSSVGFWFLLSFSKKFKVAKILIIIIVVVGVIGTAGYQKYHHNTLPSWPPGAGWTSMEEVEAYLWLKGLPANTNVFAYVPDDDATIIGLDKFSCSWCEDVVNYRLTLLDRDTEELYNWLKSKEYEYLVIGGMSYKYFSKEVGENKTTALLPKITEEIATSNLFEMVYQNNGAIIFKLR